MAVAIHPLSLGGGWEGALPEHFTYPFCYKPHPLCVMAAQEVQAYLKTQKQWAAELKAGKMFGVLVVAEHSLPPRLGLRNVSPNDSPFGVEGIWGFLQLFQEHWTEKLAIRTLSRRSSI